VSDLGLIRAIRGRLPAEDGFSIIEVLVASIILVVGAMAVFMALATSIHGVQRSKEIQQGVSVAQREMEWIRAQTFEHIGLTGNLTKLTDTSSPLNRVSSGGNEFNVKRSGTTTNLPLVTNGTLTNKVENVRSADGTTMTVYRFVVCEEAACNSKRVIVDVQTTPTSMQGTYKHGYYELQSTVTKTGA
jgi:prepilin-type N-terminal cleavage/methylation domain-containing protein